MTFKFCEHGHQEATCPYCNGHSIETVKILFVDDRTKRIRWALEQYGTSVTIATNVKEALRLLSSEYWDIVSLDHDLTGIDFEDPDTPTCGMEIVRYIEKTGWPDQRKKPMFSIHSSNLFAAHLMTVRLKSMGFTVSYQPITYKVEHMQYDKEGKPL